MKIQIFLRVALLQALFLARCSSELPTETIGTPGQTDEVSSIFELSRSIDVDDPEGLIAGSFLAWWQATMEGTPSITLGVAADAYTCGWGNWGMQVISTEPRQALDNSPLSNARYIVEDPWFGHYSAVFAASDGIRTIESGGVDLGPDTERALGFGKLVQGLALGSLALFFDQCFIIDENTNLVTDQLSFAPYPDVMVAAITKLESAIEIFDANTFTIPDDWINGRTYTSAELSQLAHSFIARYLAAVARNPAERQNVDWNLVMNHLDQGLTSDFMVAGLGTGRHEPWFSATHWYAADYEMWLRVDYKVIGWSDRSSAYADWLATAPENRDEYIGDFSDLRVWDQTLDSNGEQNPGTYIRQIEPTGFPGGGYLRSRYGHHQFQQYLEADAGTAVPIFRLSEHDFLRAEALLHLGGSSAEIAVLLDKTHVTNGGYPSAAELPVGALNDVPNPRHDNLATLWSVLKYEKNIELLGTWSGLQFWDNRGWGNLTSGTPVHFPVPARELQFLLLPNYTFGGGGPGSAE